MEPRRKTTLAAAVSKRRKRVARMQHAANSFLTAVAVITAAAFWGPAGAASPSGPCAAGKAAAKSTPKPGAGLVKPGGGLGDGITADKVRHILFTDRRFDPFDVQVVSSSGTIALNGTVKTKQARAFAQSDAQKAAGVRRVINRLKIKP